MATRQLLVRDILTTGEEGTATLTAPVTIEILNNKTLRVTALQQLEENPSDVISFDGNSSLRNITSSFVSRNRILDLSRWVNSVFRSGLNSRVDGVLETGGVTLNQTYVIYQYNAGDDFTNIGGLNVTGNVFTPTNTAPAVWTNGSILYPLSQFVDIPEDYFSVAASSTAAQWEMILDGGAINAAEHTSLGGFKISLDGLMAYIA
jgi:hypothetical protein